MWYRIIFTLFLGLIVSSSVQAQKSPAAVTVVELYTSQGCYSCPPADDYLGELKQQENTITLACHVTYWNYLGWKDTFSKRFCDNRQRNYQAHLKGYASVYTPQMVVNGRYGAVGSRVPQMNKLLTLVKQQSTISPIKLTFASADQLAIELPQTSVAKAQNLLLIGTTGVHRLPIARGENGGKKLTYHNPVKQVIHLGNWEGEQKIIRESVNDKAIKEWIVLAQNLPLGEITAAGKIAVP